VFLESLKRKKEKAKGVWVDHPEDGDEFGNGCRIGTIRSITPEVP
jgi:hypothetical protein